MITTLLLFQIASQECVDFPERNERQAKNLPPDCKWRWRSSASTCKGPRDCRTAAGSVRLPSSIDTPTEPSSRRIPLFPNIDWNYFLSNMRIEVFLHKLSKNENNFKGSCLLYEITNSIPHYRNMKASDLELTYRKPFFYFFKNSPQINDVISLFARWIDVDVDFRSSQNHESLNPFILTFSPSVWEDASRKLHIFQGRKQFLTIASSNTWQKYVRAKKELGKDYFHVMAFKWLWKSKITHLL